MVTRSNRDTHVHTVKQPIEISHYQPPVHSNTPEAMLTVHMNHVT